MIESGENLLVMAEHDGGHGPAPWYLAAYDSLLQETPFQFESIDTMTCAAGRGRPGNPMFLLNHWVNTGIPDPAAATTANDINVLRTRVEQCWEAGGRRPNIVAVDFFDVGGLMELVDSLNGLDQEGARRASP
jgi:hypothetical protein